MWNICVTNQTKLLEASTLKSLKETCCLHISIWTLTAVDFLNRTVCSLKVRYLSVHQLFLLFENTLLNMLMFTKFSLCLRTLLIKKTINSNISFCKINFFFKLSTRLANFFRFKDKIPLCLNSNIVYKFMCGRCNATYYGKTCHYFKVRVGKHSGISPLTNKWSKSKKSTAVKDHMLMFYQLILKFLLLVTMSSIEKSKKVFNLILREQPVLIENEPFLPLYLFD